MSNRVRVRRAGDSFTAEGRGQSARAMAKAEPQRPGQPRAASAGRAMTAIAASGRKLPSPVSAAA